MLNIIPLHALKDNYIWVLYEGTEAWVVDPGEARPVIEALNHHNLMLKGILLTHHHQDHCGGVLDLLDYAGNIPVIASHASKVSVVTQTVKNNDVINCGFVSFKVIEIPGHTLDHLAYYANNMLFCGDTLFSAGCGRVFEGSYEQMYDSLMNLASLNKATKIYCGHEYTLANLRFAQSVEPDNVDIANKIVVVHAMLNEKRCTLPSTLADEMKINPFLRCDEYSVAQAVRKYSGSDIEKPIDIFHQLREWKNKI